MVAGKLTAPAKYFAWPCELSNGYNDKPRMSSLTCLCEEEEYGRGFVLEVAFCLGEE